MTGYRITIFFAALVFLAYASAMPNEAGAQKVRDVFSHGSRAHRKINCGSCHKNPTPNWATARSFPDVADYPDHDSCVGCHQNEFFRGNHPAICSVCHVNAGPRGSARFPFPARNSPREFETIFPHNIHQDIIARNEMRRNAVAVHMVRASFAAVDDGARKPQFNNCAICHATAAVLPEYADVKPLKTESLAAPAAETFTPKPAFFKDNPAGHASCFNCHYQGQKPSRTECAGCHRLAAPYFESTLFRRYSLKFDHSSENHANKDCTVCHIRITQTSDLRTLMNADVPLLTCSSSACHNKELRAEIGKRDKSIAEKQPLFQCVYCHTYAIGSYRVPASHLEQAK